jgi:hypothetical protein
MHPQQAGGNKKEQRPISGSLIPLISVALESTRTLCSSEHGNEF